MKHVSARWVGCLALILAVGVLLTKGCTQQHPQSDAQLFDNPDTAVDTLVKAVRDHDQDEVKKILGPDAGDILESGDDVADENARTKFLAAYDAKHHLELSKDG